MLFFRVSDPYSFDTDPDPGSESKVLMTENWKKFTAVKKNNFLIKNYHLPIPRPPKRTSKLQKKPSALKREHPALQKMKFLNFFLLLWVIFILLDPDPGPDSEYGSGSTEPDWIQIQYGSGSETLFFYIVTSCSSYRGAWVSCLFWRVPSTKAGTERLKPLKNLTAIPWHLQRKKYCTLYVVFILRF
jgi:hypothetical protein